jgi:hypothetical protein
MPFLGILGRDFALLLAEGQMGAQAGQQLGGAERFRDVVVRPDPESVHDILQLGLRGQENAVRRCSGGSVGFIPAAAQSLARTAHLRQRPIKVVIRRCCCRNQMRAPHAADQTERSETNCR